MSTLSFFAPAKLNLFLAITGRRADGFHDLVSVVVPLEYGDTLRVETAEGWSLACSDAEVPTGEGNLVLKAAAAWSEVANARGGGVAGARFFLEKRIPMGAGLGGGSSDAVAALRALERLAGEGRGVGEEALEEIAARIGSDCPLFLRGGPVVMRGRGEKVSALPAAGVGRLRGRRVLVFKPAFGIATPWAYGRLAAEAPAGYVAAEEAEARVATWLAKPEAPAEELLFNGLERVAFAKFLALPALLDRLRAEFGVVARMSGSGSACFALLREGEDAAPMVAVIRDAWGESAFVVETRVV